MAAHDDEMVYVDIAGNEVDKNDPAVQTRYTRRDFKALDKAVVFGAARADAKEHAKSEEHDVVDAKSTDTSAAADDDEVADTPAHAASVKHGKR